MKTELQWGNVLLQMNLICVNCHGFVPSNNVYDLQQWISQHECPTVIPIENAESNVNITRLFEQLEKRNQL